MEVVPKVINNVTAFRNYTKALSSKENNPTLLKRAIGTPVGIRSASCSLAFSFTAGIVKKLLKTTKNKKKNLIKLLC